MKCNFKILVLTAFLAITTSLLSAQRPPHPNQGKPPGTPGNGPGNNNPVGGAPIGNGTFILLTLAAAYAIGKVYVMRSAKEEITE